MADIRGFRGFRYDLGRVGSLSDVVAPPYDVIGPDLQQRLYTRNDFNAIRLEFTREEPAMNFAPDDPMPDAASPSSSAPSPCPRS